MQRQQIEAKQDLKLAQAREELITRQQREKEERAQQARVTQEQDEAKQMADLVRPRPRPPRLKSPRRVRRHVP